MKKQRVYCSYCGALITKKEEHDGKLRDFCPSCSVFYYENPLPVASTIVLNENREVLLVQRRNNPYQGMWCLPIGFAESGEEVREAALRELEEEAGIIGEIKRLIDVDTVDNYFYGSLAIVTYEVTMTGGEVRPGDDAIDARYFPILALPELAWSSNEKAIGIYCDLYKDTWAMMDSFRHLYPEIDSFDAIASAAKEQKQLLSNMLITILSVDSGDITDTWMGEVTDKVSALQPFRRLLGETNRTVLSSVQTHLQGVMNLYDFEDFIVTGREFRSIGLPLPELLTALALSRKSIWKHVIQKKILASPLEIYTTLELNNRIIFIYDKIIYNICRGYCE